LVPHKAVSSDQLQWNGEPSSHIVNSDSGTFRHPVGDANVYFAWRASMTDEQWIELNGVEDDEVWCASVKQHFGIDPQFT